LNTADIQKRFALEILQAFFVKLYLSLEYKIAIATINTEKLCDEQAIHIQ
jgi:hypothetical protein